jgi:hypothetical protein
MKKYLIDLNDKELMEVYDNNKHLQELVFEFEYEAMTQNVLDLNPLLGDGDVHDKVVRLLDDDELRYMFIEYVTNHDVFNDLYVIDETYKIQKD